MTGGLERISIVRKTGEERFVDGGNDLRFDFVSFWQWSASDLLSNATRGVVAEYIVAHALGIQVATVRDEWAAYDLCTESGVKIEVKSAAYLQSWYQRKISNIIFRTPKTRAWDPHTNRQSNSAKRQADVYIFALLAHREKRTVNPIDVSQWEFYVLETASLDDRIRSQDSITLNSLRRMCGNPIRFGHLKNAVHTLIRSKPRVV